MKRIFLSGMAVDPHCAKAIGLCAYCLKVKFRAPEKLETPGQEV